VVPVAAVQTGARGTYVFVVTADNLATIKPVTIVRQRGSDAAITGIAEGDNVVVDGQLRLVEGTRVEIQKPGAAPAAAAPPSGPSTPGGTHRK
jgi:multidrug efflux system membrane fusion protein